jgi:signal transduction histidine kinase
VVGRDLEEQRRFLDDARWWFVGGFGLLALAGLGGGLLLARAIGRRVDTITAASERIMAGALSDRLPVSGRGDEIDALARQVNVMLDRIEQLLASLKEVSDNIAHDLKTPINRLRNRAEAALGDGQGAEAWRAGLERTIEEADQIIKTFNALLLISRIEAGALEESLTTFDLGDLVGDVAELYEPVAEEAGLGLEREIAAGVVVRANRQLLGQALANLLDNAIKYGLPSAIARPRLRIEVARRGSQVHLVVADQGPGIPAADRARAVERFIRLDRSRTRPGTGLGLSLVAAVARMHGGRLELEDNAPGLRVVVLLPQAQTGRVPESAGEARVGP